jgi:hypothetical protein
MKWLLIILIFHGPGAPGIVQQEFATASACQTAKTVIIGSAPIGPTIQGYCLPL